MVKLRLMRTGSKKNPHYRLIAVPSRTKRETKALESLGYYNPKTKEVKFNKERIAYWREKGAQPTETVLRLLNEKKDYSKSKKAPKKKKKTIEEK